MSAPYPNAAPSSKLVYEKSSFLHKNSRHKVVVQEHYFNASASIIIPGEGTPPDIAQLLEEESAYMIHNLPVLRLIDKEFIEAFIKRGRMYFLSHKTQLDCDDCVALLPSGILVLNLTKDTYELLGLEGKPSVYTPRHQKPLKYVVHVDVTAECFTPGRKNYNRVWWCLKNRFNLNFDFLAMWIPNDEKVCPSSIRQYFENNGHKVTEVPVRHRSDTLTDRLTPELTPDTDVTSDDSHQQVYEWLGAVACDANLSGAPDNYVNTYRPSDPCTTSSLTLHTATGFISPDCIHRLVDKLRDHISESNLPWAAITVHGFMDSPVSWGKQEHGFYVSGDNLYTYIIFPDHQYWLYSAYSTYDGGY